MASETETVPPPDPAVEAVYAQLTEGREGIALELISPHKGRGLRATRAFAAGETLFAERPLTALQLLHSRACVPACAQCLRPVGSLSAALERFAGEPGPAPPPQCGELWTAPEPDALGFCGPECAQRGAAVPRLEAEGGALLELAVATNESLLLVGRVLALVTERFATNGGDVAAATAPFRAFTAALWWDLVSDERGVAGTEWEGRQDEYRAMLRELLGDAAQSAAEALQPPPELAAAAFTPEFVATVLGTFELNNLSVSVPSPLVNVCRGVAGLDEATQLAAQAALVPAIRSGLGRLAPCESDYDTDGSSGESGAGEPAAGVAESKEEDDDDEKEFAWEDVMGDAAVRFDAEELPQVEGTALYALACQMNHSCDPNVEAAYEDDCTVHIVAQRDIAAGDEICVSYIDQAQETEERQADLLDYGFQCGCERCSSSDD